MIGAGVFGCCNAIALADAGYQVTLFERQHEIVRGASHNNTNRVHFGFHYPRDYATARACRDDFERFCRTFAPAVFEDFANLYCIASSGSKTTPADFLAFCDRLAPYELIDFDTYETRIQNCSLGVRCVEAVYDTGVLRRLLADELARREHVTVRCGVDVKGIERRGDDYRLLLADGTLSNCNAVVNCCYADLNRLGEQLGIKLSSYQFEYTFVPVVEINLLPQAITVMDGPFVTLFPQGMSGRFGLYHVEHSVLARHVGRVMRESWLSPHTMHAEEAFDPVESFESLREASVQFVPALRDATMVGFLEGPRMVLANHDHDDARPTVLLNHGDGYLSVFSGKIDRCLSIADQVVGALQAHFSEVSAEAS